MYRNRSYSVENSSNHHRIKLYAQDHKNLSKQKFTMLSFSFFDGSGIFDKIWMHFIAFERWNILRKQMRIMEPWFGCMWKVSPFGEFRFIKKLRKVYIKFNRKQTKVEKKCNGINKNYS